MHDGHGHCHDHDHGVTPDKSAALLKYMVEHNRHHAEELHELAHKLSGETAELIHQAVHDFDHGNEKLEAALRQMKEA
jgi:hypothetical protein